MPTTAPLNALRAFEAAARTGTFTAAARELGVSSAAISQQVKILEDYWGKTLFIRQGNRIALTEAGLTAYPTLARSMTALTDLSDAMREAPRRARLVLSAPHSVAETWLALRLATCFGVSAERRLELRIEEDPIDFARDRVHMRIFYGHGLYSEYQVQELFRDSYVAVAAPRFAARHGKAVERIADRFLIHTDWGRDYASSPDWSGQMSHERVVDMAAGLRVAASSTAITCARNGLGAALVPLMMAKEDLDAGRLVRLDTPEQPMARSYSVAYPNALANRADVLAIITALSTQ